MTIKDLKCFPKLRPGVKFFKIANPPNNQHKKSGEIYIGFSHRGIELKNEIASQVLHLLDGSHSIESIGQIAAISTSEIHQTLDLVIKLLQLLHDARLIEFCTSATSTQLLRNKNERSKTDKSELLPVNQVNSFNRMRAETNLYSWHPSIEIENSVEELISKRRKFSIIIYGRNRLALSLFAVLRASGFSLIKLLDRIGTTNTGSLVQIAPDEVCGLAIRGSDVGLRKPLVIADLARNSQLFPAENIVFPTHPEFIISTESIPQEIMQQWMSEATAHLLVSNLIENKINLGPIVLPGKTPCFNCLNLWRTEQYPHHNAFEFLSALDSENDKGLEIPSAQVALLTGLIATSVIEYCAYLSEGNSLKMISKLIPKLIGATLTLNLFDPLNLDSSDNESVGYRYWQPHSSCGCQRLI